MLITKLFFTCNIVGLKLFFKSVQKSNITRFQILKKLTIFYMIICRPKQIDFLP